MVPDTVPDWRSRMDLSTSSRGTPNRPLDALRMAIGSVVGGPSLRVRPVAGACVRFSANI